MFFIGFLQHPTEKNIRKTVDKNRGISYNGGLVNNSRQVEKPIKSKPTRFYRLMSVFFAKEDIMERISGIFENVKGLSDWRLIVMWIINKALLKSF